jgi:hypothetical protein
MNFLTRNKLRMVGDLTANGTTEVKSADVDMVGYEGAVFFAKIATAAAGNYIKVQESDTTTDGDYADLLGTKVVAGTNADVVAVEVYRPGKRYLRASVIRGTSTVLGEIYCNQFGPAVLPVDNIDTGIVSETHISPIAGTA